jgi:hypothetical protein
MSDDGPVLGSTAGPVLVMVVVGADVVAPATAVVVGSGVVGVGFSGVDAGESDVFVVDVEDVLVIFVVLATLLPSTLASLL